MRLSDSHRSWIIGSFLVLFFVAAGFFLSEKKTLQRLDLLIYDVMLPLHSPKMSEQIVIIAIDDASIRALGRWPWSRHQHAKLLQELQKMSPKAIGIDLIFSEPEINSNADQSLAQAMIQNQHTVLVVAPIKETSDSLIVERLPIPLLASAAAALGHVDVELDIDGTNRHFYLYAGLGNPHWPNVALAMLKVGEDAGDYGSPSQPLSEYSVAGWVRSHKMMLSFTSADNLAKRISFKDVLEGRVDPELIRDKYVLIGATSAGIGDMISTPASRSHQRMPGVEIISQEMNTLLQDTHLYELSPSMQSGLTILLIILSVGAIILSPLRYSLITAVSGLIFILSCSLFLLLVYKLWFAPATAFILTAIAWPLWTVWQNRMSDRFIEKLIVQLDAQARQHIITGLPNHITLQEELYKLGTLDQPAKLTALIIIHVNKHESAISVIHRAIGDSLLVVIADRIKAAVGDDVFVAHLEEDDFAILLSGQSDLGSIQQSANALLAQIQTPFHYLDEEIVLSPNIGISVWPMDSRDSSELLRKAFTAMFKSRMDESLPICLYTADIGEEIQARVELEKAMTGALERNEFQLCYQPQVEASSGKIIGAEALLRWHSPDLGPIGPETFIPVAEQSGLINSLGEFVLRKACDDLKLMKEAGLEHIRIAVNLSPLQFANMSLADDIAEILESSDIDPSRLELEVTESTLMRNMNTAVEAMMNIKKHGMSLAIDDFGTGYSSLKHLQLFPLDCLKIDKCFTRDIEDKSSLEITLSVIDLAKRLNLRIIAEGVETDAQAKFFRLHRCDELQGYLFSKPIPAKALIELMKERAEVA